MANREVLGHIDCPTCGTAGAMRITPDKNGEPFGYCTDCYQQMRIGGNKDRVARFVKRYGWAAGKPEPVPVTVTEPKPAPAAAKPAEKPAPVPVPAKKKPANPFGLLLGGE